MPKLLDQTEIQLEFADLNRRVQHPRVSAARTSGVHVSAILKYVAVELKMLDAGQVDKEDIGDIMPLRMGIGVGLEEFMSSLYPDMHYQPGELERDGIIGTPDAFRYVEFGECEHPVIPEFKATYKTANTIKRPILKEWMWMGQGKSYLAMWPGRGVNIVEYHVCYLAGDYKFPLTPVYRKYLVEFEEREIEEFWERFIVKYKDRAVAEVHK